MQWCSIHTCLEYALELTDLNERCEVELEIADLPPILGVEAEFVAIFINLLNNCSDALGDNPVVHIKTETDDSEIAVTIIDNGSGMDPATRKSSARMHFSTKEEGRGTGLSIAKFLVQEHGGQVRMNSLPG